MYVLLEGIDRVGKSTQIDMLKSYFKDAVFTREPGGCGLCKKIRDIVLNREDISPICEMFLFLADRNEHFEKVIKPNLDRLIISDRGFISAIAYAYVKTNLSIDRLLELNLIALEKRLPKKIIFFKITKDELDKRMHTKELDSIENRGVDYLLKVQEIMEKVIKKVSIPYITIDASLEKEIINKKIVEFIKKV